MTQHSDDAMRLAGQIATQLWYPRIADLVALAITHCTLNKTPLDDDQATQLYRAALEAGDGIYDAIAHMIDEQAVHTFMRELDGEPDGS